MTTMTEPRLSQCQYCGTVWLAAEPSAGRQPDTCPHDCQATVADYDPWTTEETR